MSYLPDEKEYMMNTATNTKSLAEITKTQRALYPEVLYKLEPFISSTCDAIRSAGVMPNQQEIDDITDEVLDDFLKMHPDMERYMNANDNENDMRKPFRHRCFRAVSARGRADSGVSGAEASARSYFFPADAAIIRQKISILSVLSLLPVLSKPY